MILVDGNNMAWRAAHAGRGLASEGRPTAVLHVGLVMLSTFPDLFEPEQVVFLWDGDGRENWRKKYLPSYKQNRVVTGTDYLDRQAVYKQIDVFRTLLTDLGFCQHAHKKLEADDLAAILTGRLHAKGIPVTLVSGDKDWFSLLQPGVQQFRSWKGSKPDVWTAERVYKEYGVHPSEWIQYLALTGDSIDNIPGMRKGFGPKAAAKAIRAGIVDSVIHTNEERARYTTNLKIVRLVTSAPLTLSLTPPERTDQNWARLESVLSEYDLFKLWGDRNRLWAIGGWGR